MAALPPPAASLRRPARDVEEIMVGQFRRQEQIGHGSFALVYRGIHERKRAIVAIKTVNVTKLSRKLKENLASEIKILQSLQHPHIVALFDCKEDRYNIHLVMEFCQLGDLSTFIKKRATHGEHPATADMARKYPSPPASGLNEVVTRHFLKQIASALHFLRERNLIHRDVKPQNLLLNPSPLWYKQQKQDVMPLPANENSMLPIAGVDSLPMLKIADFGFARSLPQTSMAETLCGSPLYMAPEILRYERYDAKADLWSTGTVLYEMVAGRSPFRASNHVDLLRKIEKGNDVIKFPEGTVVSADLKALIRALLKKQPTERMSFENFFESPVIKEEIPGLDDEDRPQQLPAPAMRSEGEESSQRLRNTPLESAPAKVDDQRRREVTPPLPAPRDQVSPSTPPQTTRQDPCSMATRQSPNTAMMVRRATTAMQSQPAVQEHHHNAPAERRPGMISYPTAPCRQDLHDERPLTPAAVAMKRRSSRTTSSPGSSMLKEQLDRERMIPRKEDKALREARERAAQDVAFERDYVLVEKRAVEVNAFADELAASPQIHGGYRERPSYQDQGAMVRRIVPQSAATTTAAQSSPSKAIQVASGQKRPDASNQRKYSYERRYGPTPGSATSAISKALNMANLRLFGMGFSPPLGKGPSPPQGYAAFPTYPITQGSVLLIGDGGKTLSSLDGDTKVLHTVEEAATRSDVVYGFGEVKYKQLVPTAPSNERGLGIRRPSTADKPQGADNETADEAELTTDAIISISEEALVLYVKALAILAKAIDLAGNWWAQKNRGEIIGDTGVAARSNPDAPRASIAAVGGRMNNVVQWARNRFNECLEKSEYVGRRLLDAQRCLPEDRRASLHNQISSASAGSTPTVGIGTSAENIVLMSGVTAEKLMYERAVEMSRAAAVNELVGEDLAGCEIAYMTAVRMLEAVLESDEGGSKERGDKGEKVEEEEGVNGVELEDRRTVEKLIEGMRMRLAALKPKIATQQANKRLSLPVGQISAPKTVNAASGSPTLTGMSASPR